MKHLLTGIALRKYNGKYAPLACLLLGLFVPQIVWAQTSAVQHPSTNEPSPISTLGDNYQNSIELLKNRFRVDHHIEEITLVFFREYGSAPVVLVKPDGSKIFQTQAEEQGIEWYDAATYDMIRLTNPVPGPWQAVGQILPDSRVMILSEVKLHAEPLPSLLFSGEILKLTARLTNGDKPIEYKEFREAVDLSIELVSTNNPNYDNFGADNQLIATFQDNGMGMDERPMDGVFTGQFNLIIPAGEWEPIFRVVTPMYTREQVEPVIILHRTPVKLDVDYDDGQRGYHNLLVDVDRELVDINSLLVDGRVRYPNGDIQNFSLTETSDDTRRYKIVAFEDGLFRVKLTVYGTTVNGRDFILDVPEYTFEVEPEIIQQPLVDENGEPILASTEVDIQSLPQPQPDESLPAPEEDNVLLTVILVNGAILLIGGGALVFVVLSRRRSHLSNSSGDSFLKTLNIKGKFAEMKQMIADMLKRKDKEKEDTKAS
ncbi:TIGR03503 family protein [Alteromonas sp. ASW11-130]|uniref:TIGR03503 family protein n=1 Tax=Alteromonas sp. ASW11-130 TaxID=3015775 RepID=UPI00224260DC|nr:TIGR03503 family protein [Alteromonas sp. ASW11-130]MCW8091987.1 TIGR03503 family protein [Alteromonas sp. ASW11-130]